MAPAKKRSPRPLRPELALAIDPWKRLQTNPMPVTIKDVARESGVNTSTVSRALNNSYGVNPQTREHVAAIAARLNYHPNRVARGLVTGRSHSIGLILS